jgi:hypothetical protein
MTELALTTKKAPAAAGAVVEVEQQRAIQEVQAAMIIAKRFPRDVDESYTRIMGACQRKTLAASAMYAYPRGGAIVTGPSIRLAETIAQNWGNLQFGIREMSQKAGESEVEAFAWDVETNTRQVKVFRVPHVRHTKKGINKLTDPRDIYEMVANQGARRLRACILGVIPGDIIDAAVAQCEKTLQDNAGAPIEDRVRKMLTEFKRFGVTKEMIEKRLGHTTSAIIEAEVVELVKIFTSLRDGMSKREQWFTVPGTQESDEAQDLNKQLAQSPAGEPSAPPPSSGIEAPAQDANPPDPANDIENEVRADFNEKWPQRSNPAWQYACDELEMRLSKNGAMYPPRDISKISQWIAAFDEFEANA